MNSLTSVENCNHQLSSSWNLLAKLLPTTHCHFHHHERPILASFITVMTTTCWQPPMPKTLSKILFCLHQASVERPNYRGLRLLGTCKIVLHIFHPLGHCSNFDHPHYARNCRWTALIGCIFTLTESFGLLWSNWELDYRHHRLQPSKSTYKGSMS